MQYYIKCKILLDSGIQFDILSTSKTASLSNAVNQQEVVYNHSSLSSCLSPGDGARAGSGDLEGVLERFCPRTGDLDAERLLERE